MNRRIFLKSLSGLIILPIITNIKNKSITYDCPLRFFRDFRMPIIVRLVEVLSNNADYRYGWNSQKIQQLVWTKIISCSWIGYSWSLRNIYKKCPLAQKVIIAVFENDEGVIEVEITYE